MGQVNPDGLTIRRTPEVIEDIVTAERALIDPNISTEDDEVIGQLNNIIGSSIASVEAFGQAVNDNFNLLKAEGVHLDNLVALIGITRISGQASSTDKQQVTGTDGTVIPAGSLVENPISLDRFLFLNDVTLTTTSCQSALYSVKDLLDNTLYTITVNGNEISYTSDADATELEILDGLKAYNDANFAGSAWTFTVDSGSLQLLIETDDGVNLNISSITFIGSDSVTTFGNAQCTVVGPVVAPANSVNSILTAVSGWSSTTNTEEYVVGRDEETDEELRARALVSQQISGRGTVEAIQDTVRNVTGVSSATVQENDYIDWSGGTSVVTFTNGTDTVNWTANTLTDTDRVTFSSTDTLPTGLDSSVVYFVVNQAVNSFQVSLSSGGAVVSFTDDGTGTNTVRVELPPKSFETVVQGGTDSAIALSIWESKPAGIETFGTQTETIQDSDGTDRTIKFTRPNDISLDFEVEYTIDPEGTPPSTAEIESSIKSVVVSVTSQLVIGQDVIPSKYYGPIYAAVTGIIVTLIQVKRTTDISFVEDVLSISPNEFATVTEDDVTVTDVTP